MFGMWNAGPGGARFCDACGAALLDPEISPRPEITHGRVSATGERRQTPQHALTFILAKPQIDETGNDVRVDLAGVAAAVHCQADGLRSIGTGAAVRTSGFPGRRRIRGCA
jgi:hypothetical protein